MRVKVMSDIGLPVLYEINSADADSCNAFSDDDKFIIEFHRYGDIRDIETEGVTKVRAIYHINAETEEEREAVIEKCKAIYSSVVTSLGLNGYVSLCKSDMTFALNDDWYISCTDEYNAEYFGE